MKPRVLATTMVSATESPARSMKEALDAYPMSLSFFPNKIPFIQDSNVPTLITYFPRLLYHWVTPLWLMRCKKQKSPVIFKKAFLFFLLLIQGNRCNRVSILIPSPKIDEM